jgi:molecular chaperone DnaK
VKDIFGRNGSQRLHADEAVAVGAAIQGAQLQLGSHSVLVVVDVVPLGLGVAGMGGVLDQVIPPCTPIPVERTYHLSTAEDNQTAVQISVYQGNCPILNDPRNRRLGEVRLEGIPAAPRGMPRIAVTLAIDHNGILDVTARDVATGKSTTARLFPSSALTPAEVERLYREAEQERLIRARFNTGTPAGAF